MAATATFPDPDPGSLQRRTLGLLTGTQIIGGVGFSTGIAVGALLAADLAGVGLSGLAQSAALAGSALLAVPVVRIMRRYGRAPGLAAAYLTATLGGAGVVGAALTGSVPLLFLGLFLFGGATTAGMQARYAAVDLAPADRRGRHLSLVVWATTVGSVAGPNLAPLAGDVVDRHAPAGLTVPTLAAPFVFASGLFALTALMVRSGLRPDPLLVARRLAARAAAAAGAAATVPTGGAPAAASPAGPVPDDTGPAGEDGAAAQARSPAPAGMRAAAAAVTARPAARLGVTAMAVGHLVMVAVMAMTPVHIQAAGHGEAHTLRVVGVVLSIHIAGMFAFAPVTGWLTDRYGRRRVILGGAVLLLVACAVAGTAGHHPVRLTVGLFLLGLGWSATMVAGSTLVSESVPEPVRPSAQGLADLLMGMAGASGGAVAGVVLAWSGYPALTVLGAVATVPLLALALRPVRERLYT